MNDAEFPLATFALIAYNQEAFVRQAVEAALAQSYSPLEIILSDDASRDSTAAIIREMAKAYRGPHKVLVNINDRNLGIGAHVNRIFEMARGELLILAGGDDISLPQRTERTVMQWLGGNRRVDAIYCKADMIDADGNPAGSLQMAFDDMEGRPETLIGFRHPNKLLVLGACSAYTRKVYKHFGPLSDSLPIEDIPLAVRASLLGGIDRLPEQLVRYRRNVSSWLPKKSPDEGFDRHFRRLAHRTLAHHLVSMQFLADVARVDAPAARHVAQQRFAATSLALQALETRRFPLARFAGLLPANPFVRFAAPAALFGFQKLHRWLFRVKNLVYR